jgi:hypothetical protein
MDYSNSEQRVNNKQPPLPVQHHTLLKMPTTNYHRLTPAEISVRVCVNNRRSALGAKVRSAHTSASTLAS